MEGESDWRLRIDKGTLKVVSEFPFWVWVWKVGVGKRVRIVRCKEEKLGVQ